ncbi:MAG: nucleotidyltransferase family protein [Bacillota bacterium]
MKNWRKVLISPSSTIFDAISAIDNNAMRIALVVDNEEKLLGTVTDGDIRRGILKGIPLTHTVDKIMNSTPFVVDVEANVEVIVEVMKSKQIFHVPIVDAQGKVLGLEVLDELLRQEEHDNWVVLMAGGLGARLRPLTDSCPKPLLTVGDKPLLETIIDNFKKNGFRRFYLAVNYKSEQIENYFGDGTHFGVEIVYLREDTRRGTAGALGLLPNKPDKPIIVMNGDLLTKVDFNNLLKFHLDQKAVGTMCVREYSFQIPYGIVKLNGQQIVAIDEKPIQEFFVNAGIYVLSPEVLEMINRSYLDMTSLFETIINNQLTTAVFPVREYWLDIGHLDDYNKANMEFFEVFK